MRAQRIKDTSGSIVLLFATRAKQATAVVNYNPPFTIMRDELRAALMHEDSAKYNEQTDNWFHGSGFWSFYTQLYAISSDPDHPGLRASGYCRVAVRWYEGDRRDPAVLKIGCTSFTGTNAKAFYKWAMFRTPLARKKGVKRGA